RLARWPQPLPAPGLLGYEDRVVGAYPFTKRREQCSNWRRGLDVPLEQYQAPGPTVAQKRGFRRRHRNAANAGDKGASRHRRGLPAASAAVKQAWLNSAG